MSASTARAPSLSGFSILITASRRTAEWSAAFTRLGAHVTLSPTLSIAPITDTEVILGSTRSVIADPPDDVIVTTAIGWRSWVEIADANGLEPDLMRALAKTRIWARGAKVRGALQGAGLQVAMVPDTTETSDDLVRLLMAQGVQGRRLAIQLHGSADLDALQALHQAGAQIESLPVYQWGPPPDPGAVDRAIAQVCTRGFDAIVFASAPGARAFLRAARALDMYDEMVSALQRDVVLAAVGPVTAEPLRQVGLEPLLPDRFRLGAMVRALAARLSGQVDQYPLEPGGLLELRGQHALVDGLEVPLSPSQLALLRRLCAQAGDVVTREQLLAALPGTAQDLHAVEVNMSRLRSALGRPGLIQTVVKRGYRLAVPLG
jgi:uroporphyrinogen-III synthase